MNDDLSHIVTKETKAVLSTYHGMGKIHTVLTGMTSCPQIRPFLNPNQPVYIMDSSEYYTMGHLLQIIYN